MKRKLLSLTLALTLAVSLLPAAAAASPEDNAPMATVVTKREGSGGMGSPVGIYDYPEYFDEGGVDAVVAAGNFYINGFAVPADEASLTESFVVNEGTMSLSKGESGWQVGRDEYATYAEAVKALINDELPGGLAIDLYDTDGDGKAEAANLWYTEGVIVNEITQNANGTYRVFRGDLKRVPSYAGRLYDAENFSATSGEVIQAENFDTSIQEGDGAIFYKTPDGWVMERAAQVNGILMEGIDHEYYQIDDTKYVDAMKYSRDNLIVAQRNGEFANAHTYFGFKANNDGRKVSMWLDPKSMAPIGLTADENAKVFLTDAVGQAREKLAGVTLSESANDNQKFAYAALEEAIKLAEETLADETALNSEYDFYVYYLYLTLHGTGDDIGAAFSGFYGVNGWGFQNAYLGFDGYFGLRNTALLVQANDFDPTSDTNDGIYISALTDQYFEGGVEAGLEALLEAGQVYLNGIPLPADAETYYMNGMPAIWQKDDGTWTWQAHDKLNSDDETKIPHNGDYSFEFARRRFVLAVSALRGMTTTIWAEEGSDVACRVDFVVKSGGQVEKIQVNADGTTTVWGVPVDATSYNTDGGPNDVEPRTIPTEHFDQSIQEGDTVLYWYDTEGWHMERCVPVQGTMNATDHFNITVNGTTYSDALIVRYNMQAGSRPSQFISAVNNLELQDIPVTLWNTDTGYVVGISHMEYADDALAAGIAYCEGKLAGKEIAVSDDGSGVAAGSYWATQASVDAYYAAYENAKTVLTDAASTDAQMDAATQALGNAFAGRNGLKLKAAEESSAADTYTVVKGDCLWNIAAKVYGSGFLFDEIAKANGISEPYTIYVGQQLTIPAR